MKDGAASNVVPMRDGLISLVSGMGTTTDPRTWSRYHARYMSDQEIDAAYRGSWVMRKAIDKPATEMVREWRDWQADSADIAKLEAEEKRLDLRNKIKRAEILRGLGGAGMVLYVGGSAEEQANPLDPTRIKAGDLKAIHVWHRSRFALGEMITAWDDPWFGHPSYYEVQLSGVTGGTSTKFHPSRVVAFKADPVADIMGVDFQTQFWGQSKVQTIIDAITNVDTADNGFAALIKDARNRRIYIPKLLDQLSTAAGEAVLAKRLQAFALGESSYSVSWLDGGDGDGKGAEKIEDRQMSWAGMPDIMAAYRTAAAAAADMPATVLWGISPQGMNATGDSDIQLWGKTIKGRQDLDLRPCMTQIDAALIPSALGKVDDSIWYEWAPLSSQSEKDEATTFWNTMQAVQIAQNTGAIPDVAMSKGLQTLIEERGWIPGLGDALAEIPEDERYPDGAEPETDENGNPIDPSGLTQSGNGREEVVPSSRRGGASQRPARRANDAEGEYRHPFGDTYNEGEPRDDHGRWTAGLAAHVEEALSDRGSHRATSFGKVSEHNASAVLSHTGVDIAGHERIIGSSEIRHAMMSHGDPVREAARGQVAIERSDFAHIPAIVEQAHTITAQGTRSASKGLRLVYQATIGGHEYHYTEQVRAKQIVALKTIRKAVK